MRVITILFICSFSISALAQKYEPFISYSQKENIRIIGIENIGDCFFTFGIYPNMDSPFGVLWKHDFNGVMVDSLVIADDNLHGIYHLANRGDSLLLFGEIADSTSRRLFVKCVDLDLNLKWEKVPEIDLHYAMFRFHIFEHKGFNYINFITSGSVLIKFDGDFNFIKSAHISETLFCGQPLYFTDSGFVFNYESNEIQHVDTGLNVTWVQGVGYQAFGSIKTGVLRLPNGGYMGADAGDTPPRSIGFLDSDFQMLNSYTQFGVDWHSRFCDQRTFAPNADTSLIFVAGIDYMEYSPPVFLGGWEPNRLRIAKFDNEILLWLNYYEDGYYYYPINMITGTDGALYLATQRYDVENLPDYIGPVVFRITPDGELPVGMHDQVNTKSLQVYPNPGSEMFTLNVSEMVQGTFVLINSSGAVVLEQHVSGSAQIDTKNLVSGIYFYQLQASDGTMYQGKWVKQ